MKSLTNVRDHDEVRRTFAAFLRAQRIRRTKARTKVLDAVLSLNEHFEAEQVVYAIKESGESVGKATVYRTLPLLVRCGILKQVRFDVKQAHYEHAFGERPHDHMVCRRCGRIVEFGSDGLIEMRNRIAKSHRFHATTHRFQIVGLCWDCAISCPVAENTEAPGRE